MAAPPNAELVRKFGGDMSRFRVGCGRPSLEAICKLAGRHGRSVSKSTVSDLLNGKRLPSVEIVLVVVKALLSNREPGPVADDHETVREWRLKWEDVHNAMAAGAVTAPRPAEPPRPAPALPESSRPSRRSLLTPQVRTFRELLGTALNTKDEEGRVLGKARFGCYAFYDLDGEPIYVGQTRERLQHRVQRHLTSQRSDATAMRVLDVHEVAELELWPLWSEDQAELDRLEYAVYVQAVAASRFGLLLNEKIPPPAKPVALPPSYRFPLLDERTRIERANPDVRLERRAANLARLASTVCDRGEVSDGMRRALLVQAARIAELAARQYSYATGSPAIKPFELSGLTM